MEAKQRELIQKLIVDCVYAAKTLVNKLVELHHQLNEEKDKNN